MSTQLSPIESEFATVEDAQSYDQWFRAKVERSIANPGQPTPHDQVMADMRAVIAKKKSATTS